MSDKVTDLARSLDAIEFLTNAHQEMKQLFHEYAQLVASNADTEDKWDAAEDICTMVTAHAMVEDELLYPAARQVLDDELLLNIAEVEHEGASSLIHVMQCIEPTDPLYDARVQVLVSCSPRSERPASTSALSECRWRRAKQNCWRAVSSDDAFYLQWH